MNRKAIAVVVFALLLLTIVFVYRRSSGISEIGSASGADPNPAQVHRKVAIIWWDVTRSLYDAEKDQGLEWALRIVTSLPPQSRYYILPIHSETQRADPLDHGDVPEIRSVEAATLFRGKLKTRINQKAEKLRKALKADEEASKKNSGFVRRDRRTCILNTLSFSSTLLNNEPKHLEPEIVFISDMIEDCFHQNLNGGKGGYIQLSQPAIEVQIKAASAVRLPEDLTTVRLTIAIPTNSSSSGVSERPSMDGLQRFWHAVLKRTNAKPENIQWSIGVLPPRLVNKKY